MKSSVCRRAALLTALSAAALFVLAVPADAQVRAPEILAGVGGDVDELTTTVDPVTDPSTSTEPAVPPAGDRHSPADLLGDDLANFGLPLAITLAFVAFLLVESRIGSQPQKLADAELTTRRPLRFR